MKHNSKSKILMFGVAFAIMAAACPVTYAQQSSLMIDDYNDSNSNANTLRFWTGGSASMTETASGSFDGSKSRRFIYQNNNWYASNVWDDRTYLDISDYAFLSFSIRGDRGGETMRLELQSGSGIPPHPSVNFSDTTTEWQEIDIPLHEFIGMDKTKMRSVSIVFQGSGTIYLDNLSFKMGEVAPPPPPPEKPESTGPVVIIKSDKTLYVNGEPFTIKGVGYQPTPIGGLPPPSDDSRFYDRDFPLLVDAGFNTIRSWGLPGRNILAKAEEYGLKVIAGFWINKVDFTQASQRNSIEQNFRNFVSAYRNEDSVLMWALGNELSLSFDEIAAAYGRSKTDIANGFYSLCNRLAEVAYEIEGDSYHPVMIINGGILYIGESEFGGHDQQLPFIDVWGVNAYYRDFHNIDFFGQAGSFFDFYRQRSDKPLVITEYGADAYNTGAGEEDEDAQAAWVVANTRQIMASDICLGGTIMEYSDEWWKDAAGSPSEHETGPEADWGGNLPDGRASEEYWGIVRIADDGIDFLEHPWNTSGDGIDEVEPRQAYYSLRELFTGVSGGPEMDPIDEIWTVEERELLEIIVIASHPEGLPLEFSIDTSELNRFQDRYMVNAVITTRQGRSRYMGRFSWRLPLGSSEQSPYSPVRIIVTDTNGESVSQDITIIVTEDEEANHGIADFTADVTEGDLPLTVHFTDLSTGVIESHLWQFGDGVTSTQEDPTHTYNDPGDRTVSLTITTDVNTDTETKYNYISILYPPPTADFTTSPDPPTDEAPLTIHFTSLAVGEVTNHIWSFGVDMQSISTEKDPSYTYNTPGTYNIIYAVRGPGGSDYVIKEDYVIVSEPQPDPSVTDFTATPTNGAAPLTVQFKDESTEDFTSRQWYFHDGVQVSRDTKKNPFYTYNTPGTYNVTLIASGPDVRDSMTKKRYITVTAPTPDPPVANFTTSPTSGDAPLTVTFTNTSTGTITSSAWNFGDQSGYGNILQSGYGETVTHTYNDPGTYTVSLTATGPGGSDEEVKTNLVTVSSPAPVAGFGVSARYPRTGLAPLTIQFSDLSTGNIIEWFWNFGDGGSSREQNPLYIYNNPGVYPVALAVRGPSRRWDDEMKLSYITVTAQIPDPPVANFTTSRTSGDAPLTVAFTDTSMGTISTLQWNFGDESGYDNIIQSGYGQMVSHTYNIAGTYNVALTATGPGGSNTETKAGLVTVSGSSLKAVFDIDPEFSSRAGPAPHTVQFLDNSEGDISYWAWSFGDGGIGSERNPTHEYRSPGIYTVRLIVIGRLGGSAEERKINFINVTYPLPTADFTASPTERAAPLTVYFVNTSTGTIYDWSWDFGDGNTGYGDRPSHTYTEAGDYDVTLTVTGPGGSDAVIKSDLISVADNTMDFEQLKARIDNAYDGEEIEITPSIYQFTSNLEIAQDITLISRDPDPENTVFMLGGYHILIKVPGHTPTDANPFGGLGDVAIEGITIRGYRGISVNGPIQSYAENLTLNNCRIIDNEGIRASAVYTLWQSTLRINNTLIADNYNLTVRLAQPASLYLAGPDSYCGAIFLDNYAAFYAIRSTIADNYCDLMTYSYQNGYGQSGYGKVNYGAVHRNNTGIAGRYGNDQLSVVNSIMWNNTNDTEDPMDISQSDNEALSITILNSDIQQYDVAGEGIFETISEDPYFRDPDDYDYTPQNSNCAGMGVY
ncbi:MAG: PKD domain-containing protein [Candidatus Omnitrophica bacterium]|nr:PKD domain-containing protein [Candidatus Omnitrophota bacterium]